VARAAAESRPESATTATGATETAAQQPTEEIEKIVVVGSRTPRSAVRTPVPIDVFTAADLATMGINELDQAIAVLAPSFNATRQTISDGTDHLNPASLRGLGPDQVLVLVNGKRRHSSALLHVNGTFGRGTVGVDMNAIPIAAVKRIEILRDGAAAQYGSDAIAGVINVVLRESSEQLLASVKTGISGSGDGQQVNVGVNFGLPIGESGGVINVTGEVGYRGRTNRSQPFTGDIFAGVDGEAATDAELAARGLTREDFSMKTGQSKATSGSLMFNGTYRLSLDTELYFFGGLSHLEGRATGFSYVGS
jgi:iron complex outermembrane receptor protein